MPTFAFSTDRPTDQAVDVLVLPVFEGPEAGPGVKDVKEVDAPRAVRGHQAPSEASAASTCWCRTPADDRARGQGGPAGRRRSEGRGEPRRPAGAAIGRAARQLRAAQDGRDHAPADRRREGRSSRRSRRRWRACCSARTGSTATSPSRTARPGGWPRSRSSERGKTDAKAAQGLDHAAAQVIAESQYVGARPREHARARPPAGRSSRARRRRWPSEVGLTLQGLGRGRARRRAGSAASLGVGAGQRAAAAADRALVLGRRERVPDRADRQGHRVRLGRPVDQGRDRVWSG